MNLNSRLNMHSRYWLCVLFDVQYSSGSKIVVTERSHSVIT